VALGENSALICTEQDEKGKMKNEKGGKPPVAG